MAKHVCLNPVCVKFNTIVDATPILDKLVRINGKLRHPQSHMCPHCYQITDANDKKVQS